MSVAGDSKIPVMAAPQAGQHNFKVGDKVSCFTIQVGLALASGLPDFSWYMIPKLGKNVPNEHIMYHIVIEYL
jgi:hypothetical protein